MSEDLETIDPIARPPSFGKLTNQQILMGQKHDPLEIIKIYSDGEWERFVREWVEGLRTRYREVRRASGAGDKGRDVIGYVEAVDLPHPGIVVLDSPLVTYKRRDTTPDEEIPEDVTSAFYEALAKLPAGRQVIVLENNDPPAAIHSKINYTHFSRSTTGRYGFFPV